ncbi:Triacylglycerol lipase 2 precursor, putative [Ricinus communis]|uniref:Triacylglycerol lipase 2, putative n=1 Tax=Ricinus communis TaxID=3988 RepID=B9SSJ8_RICCO|nr:Triacylglycerol lipase 2 precursor, putative [Ricinus communis]
MQRFRSKGTTLLGYLAVPHLKKKALNSWSAVQDTYSSTKDLFERHRVVFTVGTSVASVATAWGGYCLRHLYESKVDQRLESIEKAMKNNYHLEHAEFKKLVDPGSSSIATCIATAGTTFVVGYGFGWRGGRWYTNRKFRKEQMKMLEQIKPKRWQLLGRVTTQDGFILGIQRVTKGQSGGTAGNKTPVLLQHGILMDGAVWVMLPPGESLAFLLADDGYDVWLGNARGTKSSSGHTSLTPDDLAFWDWSWDELAGFDLPATFQYVYNQTGQQMHYVAHSLDQLADMMRSAALLGPVAYLGQITSPLAKVAADILIANESYWLGLGEFDPTGDAGMTLINDVCNTPGVDCSNILSSFTGPNCCLDTSLFGVFLSHGPLSTTTKNLIHHAQMIKGGTLTMYDYNNEDENKKHYGQPTPPVYNITNIPNDVPLFLGCGGKDALSDTKDVELLLDGLKDHVKDKLVVQTIENYTHADFILATNAKKANI